MAKFKVGDKVKVIASAGLLKNFGISTMGITGSVTSIIEVEKYVSHHGFHYKCSDEFWYREHYLELVTNEVKALYKVKVCVKEIPNIHRVVLTATYSGLDDTQIIKQEFTLALDETISFETMTQANIEETK